MATPTAARHDWIRQSHFHSLTQKETLELVLKQAQKTAKSCEDCFVVIDLDSTLYDVRNRTLAIIRSWLRVAQDLPEDVLNKLTSSTLTEIGYSLKDTFEHLQLDLKHLPIELAWKQLKDYWWDHFFSNHHLHHDQPYLGAVEYAKKLLETGTTVIYLTGRDTPRMGPGTIDKLIKDGFPLDGRRARLVTKHDEHIDDATHKAESVLSLTAQGPIVASFENEPRNLMALVQALPQTIHVFVETSFSDHPAPIGSNLYRIRDFSMD